MSEQRISDLRLCVAAMTLLLCGCQPVTNKPDAGTASKLPSNLTYFKDVEHDICFASVSSRSYSGYGVLSITTVPCDKVGL